MGERLDLLKSFVRTAAKASTDRIARLGPLAGARSAIEELKQRRASVSEGALSSAVAHAPGVRASTVSIRDGQIRVELTLEDGASKVFAVVPEGVRFAPRGAKEVLFSVEPPALVSDARVRDAVGCVAAAIARALWGPVLPPRQGDEQALVEREGARLRTDLRTVPAVRAALEGSALALALDVLTIESFLVEERTLRVKIGLPFPPR
jgi:hypothetical protein